MVTESVSFNDVCVKQPMSRILVISNSASQDAGIFQCLGDSGCQLSHISPQADLPVVLDTGDVDLVVVDSNIDGAEAIALVGDIYGCCNCPIMLLGACDDSEWQIRAYNAGADQCLVQPVSAEALVPRINALLRRRQRTLAVAQQQPASSLSHTRLALNARQLGLTDVQRDVFNYLVNHGGRVIPKQELQQKVLLKDFQLFDRNLDMHISNIRKKLVKAGFSKALIKTVRSIGYSYQPALARLASE